MVLVGAVWLGCICALFSQPAIAWIDAQLASYIGADPERYSAVVSVGTAVTAALMFGGLLAVLIAGGLQWWRRQQERRRTARAIRSHWRQVFRDRAQMDALRGIVATELCGLDDRIRRIVQPAIEDAVAASLSKAAIRPSDGSHPYPSVVH